MSNALHDYAKLFERYAANNGGTGAILAGEDCLALANEMRMDADAIDAENAKLRELVRIALEYCVNGYCGEEDECPLYESRHSCRLYAEARELGVEVD